MKKLSANTIDFFRPLLIPAALYMVLSALLRLVLWWRFGVPEGAPWRLLPTVITVGALNDAIELLYLVLPFSLYRLLWPTRFVQRSWHHRLAGLLFYLLAFAMLYLSAAEYFFFDEFNSRFNLVAVDYLIYPHEVLVNIWDSYPVLQVILATLLFSAAVFRFFGTRLQSGIASELPLRARGGVFGLHLVLVCAVSFVFSTNSLAFSDNRVINEISANGVSSLFKAFRTNDLDYSRHYRTLEDEEAFSLIRRQLTRGGGSILGSEPRDLNRFFLPEAHGLGRMNVVVIVEESFGAGYLGSYGDTRGLSPNFDRLASKGLRFANAFATGTRTVRGLEAISASFPPIPSESIIKRPGSEGIANWGKVMGENGYNTSFFYGGYGYFDNMNHFFANNGFAISDRSDISEPAFANIWGVSDEDLFGHALTYFDGAAAKGEPFFSIIMTTSNHKPYTFPEGIPGVAPGGGGRRDGIRYADYALGRFFENAPQHEWFDNTLFVVVADHDARVYGRAQVPVDRYRIPLLLYAPKVVAPGTVDTATSQIDIAPTVLGMLGLPYSAPFYGQNVLAADPDAPRPILLNHNHDVALLEGSDMVVLGLQESVDYFRYDETSHQLAPAEENLSLRDRAVAYYQTAFELFKNHGYE